MHIKRRLILRFIIIKNVWMAAYLLHSSSLCVFIITNSCAHNFINALATMISFKCLNKKYISKYLTKLSSKHGIIKCNIALLIIMRYIFNTLSWNTLLHNIYTCKTMITEKLNCLLLYYLQHYESPTETKSNGLYTEHRVIGDLSNLIVRYSWLIWFYWLTWLQVITFAWPRAACDCPNRRQ